MPSAALVRPALLAAAGSHPGLERENNEDRYHCDPRRGLFMVIDGVGGHAAGEKAAATALAMLRARLERETGDPTDRVREAITLANNEIFRLASTEPAWSGMACVLTVAIVREGRATIGHVGDTRLYAFRGGALSKVTHDHSPVGTREDRGEIGELDAMRHPRRNEIYRDVGSQHHEPGDEDFIETVEFPFESDTALVLCTDGLSDMIPSTRLAAVVSEHAADPGRVVERLIEAANEAGGKDNVTAVFVAGPRFAETARRYAPAEPVSGGGKALARLGELRQRVQRALSSRPAMLAYGLVGGLAVAAAVLLLTDAVPDRLLRLSRPAAWSRTWRVGAQGGDFATIQAALEAAQAGDLVLVDPGTYDLPIVVPPGVTLAARTARETVLRAPAGDARSPGIALSGRARIKGFKIDAAGLEVGIAAQDDEAEIDDVEVVGTAQAAIALGQGSRTTVRSSFLHDNRGAAVSLDQRALPRLISNVITGNGRAPAPAGRPGDPGATRAPVPIPAIVLRDGASAVFFGNIVAGNGDDQIAGLPAERRADVVRDNVIGLPTPQRGQARPPAGRGGSTAGRTGTVR